MIKLVISDVDGTLIGDGQGREALDPAYYDEIRRLRERGIQFVVCSGRQRASIQKLFEPVLDHLILACDGGSMVYDRDGLVFAQSIDRDRAFELIRDAEKLGEQTDIMVCGTRHAYCKDKSGEMYQWLTEGYGFDLVAVEDLTKIQDEFVKISIYHKNRVEEITDQWFRPKWEGSAKLTLAGIQWLDCVPQSAGKRSAVTFIQEKLKIMPEETVIFGDNQNDIEMFERAGVSYAVENARDEVKRAAHHICGPFYKNGVLEVLRSL